MVFAVNFHRTARALEFECVHVIPNSFLDMFFFLGGGVKKLVFWRYGISFISLNHGMVPEFVTSNKSGCSL